MVTFGGTGLPAELRIYVVNAASFGRWASSSTNLGAVPILSQAHVIDKLPAQNNGRLWWLLCCVQRKHPRSGRF